MFNRMDQYYNTQQNPARYIIAVFKMLLSSSGD